MENTLTKLENLAKFIVLIHRYYRDYYGMTIADIAHPRHRYLNPDVVEIAFKLNNHINKNLDIISYNQIYSVLNYIDSTDLFKIISGEMPEYEQAFKRLLTEHLIAQMYDANFYINKLKDLVLRYLSEDTSIRTIVDFNSKGRGFRVIDNDDVFFKVLKQGQYKNHPLRKQLEALTEENVEPDSNIPIFADENYSDKVSGFIYRVYTIDREPRVDIFAIDESTLTSLINNRNIETCEYYILQPIFSKKKDKVLDENDDKEIIENITGLVGFRMMTNRSHVDMVRNLRGGDGIYYPLYDIINLKGNVTIDKILVPSDPLIIKAPEVPLENIKEIKMKEATFELNDTLNLLEYLHTNDMAKVHPVSKRIQALTGEYPRPISIIRNMINSDDLADILIETNNNPEGFVTAINHVDGKYQATIVAYPNTKLAEAIDKQQSSEKALYKIYPRYLADDDIPSVVDSQSVDAVCALHCFDYREIKPAKVLKFKK